MFWLIVVILFITGIIAGTIGSLVGLGGGIIIVPVLMYLSVYLTDIGITPQNAVGTSLFVIIITAIASTLSYSKQRKIDYKSGFIFFAASGPGAIVGAYLNGFFDDESFQLYFGIFIILISILLMFRDKLPILRISRPLSITRTYNDEESEETITYSYSILWALPISFFVGMLSGLFGIGGGALMVPAMILLFQFPPKLAAATSMFMILFSAVSGSIFHAAAGNIEWILLIGLIPGAWLGGKIGAHLSKVMKSKAIVITLRLVLIIMGVRMIIEYLY